jgi:hypothetical protein
MAREIAHVAYFKVETPQAAAKLRELIALGGDAVVGPWDGEEAITLLADLDAGATGSMTGGGFPDGIRQVTDPYFGGDREAAVAAYGRWLPLINYENRQCGLLASSAAACRARRCCRCTRRRGTGCWTRRGGWTRWCCAGGAEARPERNQAGEKVFSPDPSSISVSMAFAARRLQTHRKQRRGSGRKCFFLPELSSYSTTAGTSSCRTGASAVIRVQP